MTLAEKYAAVLEHLRELPASRQNSLAITKLEESVLWAACGIEKVEPVEWMQGQCPASVTRRS